MERTRHLRRSYGRRARRAARSQRGTAIIISVMVMALLALFVAASLSRVTNEALIMNNDFASTQAYFAAQAGLEHMTRDFSDIFDVKMSPSGDDLEEVAESPVPGFDEPAGKSGDDRVENVEIVKTIEQDGETVSTTVEPGNDFSGLVALRTSYRLTATAREATNAEVRLTRTLNNYTIPIFQFGIFYDDPMELHPGPPFNFGGRVHTNGDLYLAANNGLKFRDRVTAVGEVVVDVGRNGVRRSDKWGLEVEVNDGLNSYKKVTQGSVVNGPDTPERKKKRGNGTQVDDPNLPDGTKNASWPGFSTRFRDNLKPGVDPLKLPLQLDGNEPIEIIRRGFPGEEDSKPVTAASRYYNKTGLRITLADSRADLPGGAGGVRLDGAASGDGSDAPANQPRGYQPKTRPNGATATRVNGYRLARATGRQVWIKVEAVSLDPSTLKPTAVDVTEEILSLGMTERVENLFGNSSNDVGDPDAVVKIQRFAMPGPPLMVKKDDFFNTSNDNALAARYTVATDSSSRRRNAYGYYKNNSNLENAWSFVASDFNVLLDYSGADAEYVGYPDVTVPANTVYSPWTGSSPSLKTTSSTTKLVPFPIMMFDTREGLYNDSLSNTNWTDLYASGQDMMVPARGVMSVVDFDVANFRRLVEGNITSIYNGLDGADVPKLDGEGWVVYISDRRGDLDDDGEFDMENTLVSSSGEASTASSAFNEYAEDANHNGEFDVDYATGVTTSGWLTAVQSINGEAPPYNVAINSDEAALVDTPFYRRAVRLVNGTELPGTPDDDPDEPGDQIEGFTFSSENGAYILGNYNSTGVSEKKQPTPYTSYQGRYVPSSVVADTVMIQSNAWMDSKSFRYPFTFGAASRGGRIAEETTVRTALLMGDTISARRYKSDGTTEDTALGPTAGGSDVFMTGGVHNFKRFVESWEDSIYMNYCGSLINLFNSVNNSGPFKCCTHVYRPPMRNWVFDATFLDPQRLPPGTPFFQYINITGFRRTYAQGAD